MHGMNILTKGKLEISTDFQVKKTKTSLQWKQKTNCSHEFEKIGKFAREKKN